MFSSMDHATCPEKCLWKRYHSDLSKVPMKTYMNTQIGHVNIGTSRQTRLTTENDSLVIADGIKLVKERLHTLVWRLHHDLSVELFDKDTEIIIEHCRNVSDLKSLVSKIYEKGSTLVGYEESEKFITSARVITGTVSTISDDDFARSFRVFVSTLDETFVKKCQ